ncbi:hypothetical protein BN961_04003 [Afipia felis]|uniref:Uncharacterized protein n=1 Tax=Afipia felis TaxID=1035 RepID=A0A090N8V0_AFIFE|nr:hypothetical protein BN961_04003 [Afipia felis]
MFDEAGCLNIVRMRQHELLILRGSPHVLAEFSGAQGAIDQRHRHRLALGLAEVNAVAACEAGGFGFRALELVYHLAFRDGDRSERHGKADLGGDDIDLDFADTDFTGERVVAAVAALRRIAERQQKALIASREVLQAQIPIRGKVQRLAREIADGMVGDVRRRGFDQAVLTENVRYARHRRLRLRVGEHG